MKRFKIVIAIFVVGIGLLGASNVQAQNDTDDININTTVLTELTVTKTADVDFGTVFTGVTPTLDPTPAESHSDEGSSAQVGQFDLSGSGDVNVSLSFDNNQPSLTDGEGTDIQYNVHLEGNDASDQTGTEQTVFDYTTTSPTTNSDVTLNSSGNYFLWLGGTLTADGDATADLPAGADGDYSTTLTLTATYN